VATQPDPRRAVRVAIFLFASLLSAAFASAEPKPPAGFGPIEHTIDMGVVTGLVRFDREFFVVGPGATVMLRFENNDLMPHNVVICTPGKETCTQVAEQAWALGERAAELAYIPPESKNILQHTGMLSPGESEVLYFRAPEVEDDYPFTCTFPRHAFTMRGIMRVSSDLHQPAPENLTAKPIELVVENEPIVHRTTISDVSTSAIAVGSPTSLHYVFNPEQCAVALIWKGRFLDVSRDRMGRGGGGSKIIGDAFFRDLDASPLRVGSARDAPSVRFGGYRLEKGYPIFSCSVNGVDLTHSARPDPKGEKLLVEYTLSNPKRDVYYVAPRGREGQVESIGPLPLRDGLLRLKAAEKVKIQLEIGP
jgi:plastocyanin